MNNSGKFRHSLVERGPLGELIGVTTAEVDEQTFRRLEEDRARREEERERRNDQRLREEAQRQSGETRLSLLRQEEKMQRINEQIAETRKRVAEKRQHERSKPRIAYERFRHFLDLNIDYRMADAGICPHPKGAYVAKTPNAAERALASLIDSRVRRCARRALGEVTDSDAVPLGILTSLPRAARRSETLYAAVGYIDARVDWHLAPLRKRIPAGTVTANDASRAQPPATYQGVWRSDAEYSRGNMVTHNGCLWHCEADGVTARPGKTPGGKLMHKSMEKTGTR